MAAAHVEGPAFRWRRDVRSRLGKIVPDQSILDL